MDWIEAYVDEVVRHVPPKRRDEAAVAIREDIEAKLPDQPTETEVKRVLEQMGHPAIVAARYKDGQYLIGPKFFPMYVNVVKLVVPIVMAVVFFGLLMASIPTFSGPAMPTIGIFLTNLFDTLWDVGIQLVFWITLVFFLIERYAPSDAIAPDMSWNVSTLRDRDRGGRISKLDAGFGLFFTAVWFGVYLNAERFLGIYESTGEGFSMIVPIFNQSFLFEVVWLFLAVILLQVVLGVWKWVKGRWTYALASFNLIYNVASAAFIIWMAGSSRLFDPRFIDWVELNVPNDVFSFGWVFGLVVAITILAAVFDTIDGYRKAWKTPTHRKRPIAQP
ncbi:MULTISPECIES: hypothetical protein [unclassified Exiguobacterium]|uniref:hypothetical protein n=1 Tax=unclassified Exiguobacterium TaxID=2644629 RepID=UPI0010387F27|nr:MULTISPECIES: hypothetical protein [unclassified Exiguobacterium]TCI32989.1 hypothetical protein EVJ29_14935 [Exiguobacterium sp. SH4S7]TCI42152.1 hypothetical protein EVJ31_14650 [Exiguobacterium sp. SH5S32]TCI49496.1 hypothetical protein EVJ25_14625 [Exiguobacterium sp. SH1S4]TCI58579.1 hypothetical protein EVJ21_15020 [Exiguobacterium sp. SH0S2]TCI66862.1 hypothetical protein EVJ23_14640 [Exiguobacterium sp. SH1S1]